MATPRGFSELVSVHQHLVRNPDATATDGALYAGHSLTPGRWTPTLQRRAGRGIDTARDHTKLVEFAEPLRQQRR